MASSTDFRVVVCSKKEEKKTYEEEKKKKGGNLFEEMPGIGGKSVAFRPPSAEVLLLFSFHSELDLAVLLKKKFEKTPVDLFTSTCFIKNRRDVVKCFFI